LWFFNRHILPTLCGNASAAVLDEAGGPRQPWHDWHCKIEGPAAYDILTNFEQRWRKLLSNIQQQWRKATHRHSADDLIQIERISWILGPNSSSPPEGDPKLYVTKDDDPESWHVQVSDLRRGCSFLQQWTQSSKIEFKIEPC